MNRISHLDPAQSTGKTKQLFDAVQSKLGLVPNLVRVPEKHRPPWRDISG